MSPYYSKKTEKKINWLGQFFHHGAFRQQTLPNVPLNAISPSPFGDGLIANQLESKKNKKTCLDFGNGDGTLGANFYAGLATKTFIRLYRLGLTVNHFINLCGTGIHTFLITDAFILINNNFPHVPILQSNKCKRKKETL